MSIANQPQAAYLALVEIEGLDSRPEVLPRIPSEAAIMDSAMASTAVTTIFQFILMMTWTCLNDTPNSQKNVYFLHYIPSKAALEEIASLTSITFASGLFNVLQAASPPTIEYFKTLSTEILACWAVYIVILEKLHCRPRIYIGSGTNCRGLGEIS